jgi:NRPS condensation-like uncharacterized protein
MTLSCPPTVSVPLNRLDELFLNLDHGQEPWNVHFEVRARGRLDADRLAEAIRAAALIHPLARARLAPWQYSDRGYRWEIADALVDVPMEIAECADDAELAVAREHLLGHSPSLDAAPPFTMLLAHVPGGDSLALNLHHAAGDGIGAARLMRSILRAYAGDQDPVPPLDPLAVRDVRALAGAATLGESLARTRALARHTARQWTPPSRVAAVGGDGDRPGYGVEAHAFSRDETDAVHARRTPGTTFNDVLVASLVVAIRRWNSEHGRSTRRIAISLPVNLRPPEWRNEVLGNFASYVTVSGGAAHDLARALVVVARQTRTIKREGLAGMVVDMLAGPSMLTIAAKRRLPELLTLTGDRSVDTASLSNLGALESFGDEVESVWFSPPGRMPLGAAFGAVTQSGRLFVTLRYRHAQFDARAAGEFMAMYTSVVQDAQ